MAQAALQPLKKRNLSETVYEEIRSALIEGRYKPGDRLTITRLAEELGVSITPVREAIFRLVSDRALEMKAATAIHVPEISAAQLREIQTIRILLEGEAARVAAGLVTEEQLRRLEEIHREFQSAAATDSVLSSLHNRRFHFAILDIAAMPLLRATVENMWALTGPLIRIYMATAPVRDLTGSEHGHFEVLEGFRMRDGDRARRALQDDIRVGQAVIEWIESRLA